MAQTKSEKEQSEVIANCDAIVFGSYLKEATVHTVMTFMQTKQGNKVEPTEMGHKFNILLFSKICPKEEEVEMFTAILGDPKAYVERMGKAGYHGLVVKQKACKHKDAKDVFWKVLYNYGFEEKLIKKVIKATVV